MKHILILLLSINTCYAEYLDCKEKLPVLIKGKVVGFIVDTYNFKTSTGILITFEEGQCKVYKTYGDVVRADGWTCSGSICNE